MIDGTVLLSLVELGIKTYERTEIQRGSQMSDALAINA